MEGDVSTVLASLRQEIEDTEFSGTLYEFEDYYERKLWHQLTLALNNFFANPESKIGDLRTRIYDLFVSKFALKLNQIVVVDFLLAALNDKDLSKQQNVQSGIERLVDLQTSIKNLYLTENSNSENSETDLENDPAVIYIGLQLARFLLISTDKANHVKAEEILDELNDKFEGSGHVNEFEPKINAAFYLSKCQLFKISEDYNQFYTNCLLYLSTMASEEEKTSISKISHLEKQKLCYDLAIAALLGSKIYNFGELILHDILESLKESQWEWLYNLIHTLNAGDLKGFNQWLSQGLQKAPFLVPNEHFLRQKIIIMALLELISLKPAGNKLLQFSEISDFTGADTNDVEHLIIKCFSLGLIKGYINQIESKLVVTWLQPRILNMDQVKVLYDHLVKWDTGVEKLGSEIYQSGGSLWASV